MARSSCSIQGCNRQHEARGWCDRHYRRWRKHGDPLGGGTFRGEPLAFLEKAIFYKGDDCLKWPFSTHEGYGHLRYEGQMHYASRLVCEAVNGSPPSLDHKAFHTCGNGHKGCCNPRHLRWSYPKEISFEMSIRGTQFRGKRHSNSRLREFQILAIRNDPRTQREIANDYGIVVLTVRKIQRRESWGHIP